MENATNALSSVFWGTAKRRDSKTSVAEDNKPQQIAVPELIELERSALTVTISEPKPEKSEESESVEAGGRRSEDVTRPHTPEPVVYNKYVWTHPMHHGVTLCGLFCQLAAFNLILIAEFVIDWYVDDIADITVNKYHNKVVCGQLKFSDMLNNRALCTEFYADDPNPYRCSYSEFVKPDSDFQEPSNDIYVYFIQIYVWIGIALTGVGLLVHWLVFWPLWMFKGKVYHVILKSLVSIDSYGVFVKMLGGWLAVYYGFKFHQTASEKHCARDLQYNTLFVGFIFFAALAEMLAVITFLLALDKGNGTETHLERLARENAVKDTLKKEIEVVCSTKRRRSTYAPDSSKGHSEHLMRVASIVESDKEKHHKEGNGKGHHVQVKSPPILKSPPPLDGKHSEPRAKSPDAKKNA